ncbi:MAG: baseplate J/gp47 family protein [Desulfovibrionaceae bacterium]|nr:baseplate J/gp47 family protein [Desulfovibrionaceae bacterium]
MINLESLPAPLVVEPLDFEAILAEIKADLLRRYPDAADVLDLESEPLTKLMEAFAYRELLYRARVNDAARAHLLAFATGSDLDHLAALFGVLRQPAETDERLRARLQLRIAAMAGQGTREHYEFHAMTACADVRAAHATTPQPGAVRVVLWLEDGADADAVQQTVLSALDADDVRVLGVPVTVGAARPKPIDVSARIWHAPSALPTLLDVLRQRMADAFAARATLGMPVSRSWITTLLHADGVAAVEFMGNATPPASTPLADDEYPVPGVVTLDDMGVFA